MCNIFIATEHITRLPSPIYSCPYCHAPGSVHLIQIKKNFFIFCIPIGPGKKKRPFYRCTRCHWTGPFLSSPSLPKDDIPPSMTKSLVIDTPASNFSSNPRASINSSTLPPFFMSPNSTLPTPTNTNQCIKQEMTFLV